MMGLGLQSRRKYHFLGASHCSSVLYDPASLWKAEVGLPLQTVPLRQASQLPSPLCGLKFPEDWRHPEGPATGRHLHSGWRQDEPRPALPSHWGPTPVPKSHHSSHQAPDQWRGNGELGRADNDLPTSMTRGQYRE